MLSAIILGLDLCVGQAVVKHQQRLWRNSTIYKGAQGLGSEASQSQRVLRWWRGSHYGRVYNRCEPIAVFQRLCFLKHFNVLPQLEVSVSKIINGPIFFHSVPQEACFFEVDGNWCGNHEAQGRLKSAIHSCQPLLDPPLNCYFHVTEFFHFKTFWDIFHGVVANHF